MDQDYSKVFIPISDCQCEECGESLQEAIVFFIREDDKLICLKCAGLDRLVHLPDGDAAIKPMVCEYPTPGIAFLGLITIKDFIKAKGGVVPVVDLKNEAHKQQFARRIRDLFPSCPADDEEKIIDHFCEAGSGRVGCPTSGKSLDHAVKLAVAAYIRHTKTNYYDAYSLGIDDNIVARDLVIDSINDTLAKWESDDGDDPD